METPRSSLRVSVRCGSSSSYCAMSSSTFAWGSGLVAVPDGRSDIGLLSLSLVSVVRGRSVVSDSAMTVSVVLGGLVREARVRGAIERHCPLPSHAIVS